MIKHKQKQQNFRFPLASLFKGEIGEYPLLPQLRDLLCTSPKQTSTKPSQSGFTIIECLIAVVVVSILMTAIAPVIAISVSTRAQSKRVELAAQAARSYIDGVRAGTIKPPEQILDLNEVVTTSTKKEFSSKRGDLVNVAAPSIGVLDYCPKDKPDYPYCQNDTTGTIYCIDRDGQEDSSKQGCSKDSAADLVVQAFRTANAQNYLLGVRVYRASAFNDTKSLSTGIKQQGDPATKQTIFTAGMGNIKAPLVQMTAEIGSAKPTLRDYCDRLGGCNN